MVDTSGFETQPPIDIDKNYSVTGCCLIWFVGFVMGIVAIMLWGNMIFNQPTQTELRIEAMQQCLAAEFTREECLEIVVP